MIDPIDRQTVLDALDELCDVVCAYSKKQRAEMCGACLLGSAFDVIEALPPAEQDWIPCSKQMPVEGVAVWVTIAGHDLIIRKDGETIEDAIDRISKTRWVTQGFFGSDGWYGVDGYPMMVRPIAWMPLEKPKAYEGEV